MGYICELCVCLFLFCSVFVYQIRDACWDVYQWSQHDSCCRFPSLRSVGSIIQKFIIRPYFPFIWHHHHIRISRSLFSFCFSSVCLVCVCVFASVSIFVARVRHSLFSRAIWPKHQNRKLYASFYLFFSLLPFFLFFRDDVLKIVPLYVCVQHTPV